MSDRVRTLLAVALSGLLLWLVVTSRGAIGMLIMPWWIFPLILTLLFVAIEQALIWVAQRLHERSNP